MPAAADDVALTVNQFSTAARVVHDSDLIAVLPHSFVRASGLADGLALHPFPGALPAIEVSLLWHRRHERDAAQRWWRVTFTAAARSIGIGIGAHTEATAKPLRDRSPSAAAVVAQQH